MKKYRFCPLCQNTLKLIIEDDNKRLACLKCGWRFYGNPLPSVAAFVRNKNNEILLIKRGVAPGKGKWALPSGFIEQDELPEEAAVRELLEEAAITGTVKRLLGVFIEPTKVYGNVLLIGYEIKMISGKAQSGSDTLAAKFFPVKQLPIIYFASHRNIIKEGLK